MDTTTERLNKFYNFKNDGWYGRLWPKLRKEGVEYIENFIRENGSLNRDDFQFKVNRLFLWDENKPKSWKFILEFLTISN